MKRLILVVLLVAIAAVAGIVRSHTSRGVTLSKLPQAIAGESENANETREEIRQAYKLTSGARVRVSGINGAVKVETSETTTAEVHIERIGKSAEALGRRKVVIEATANSLDIRGKKGDAGLIARMFGSNPTERVTLKLPRQIALATEGVNGSVIIGEVDGPVEVHGVNGRVEVAQAKGAAEFHGINGNISVALKEIQSDSVSINGINGNIELRLAEGMSADLEAHGMNGNVVSDLPDFVLEKAKHGNYLAHVGRGGNSISANGINGNIRLSRVMTATSAKS